MERCLREGFVGGEGFAVDASLIAADANKQRSIPGDQWPIAGLGADAGKISYQVLMIPATDASVDTPSYHEYGTGRFLTRAFMKYG